MSNVVEVSVDQVVVRKDLYPRIEHNQQKAQEYSENVDQLPPIEINQNSILIDGLHRLTGHKLAKRETIRAVITETRSDNHLLALAIERNAAHGLQMAPGDKRKMAQRFYLDESSWDTFASTAKDRAEIKKLLGVMLKASAAKISDWLKDIDQKHREERREKIIDMYLRCHTQQEIGDAVGLSDKQAGNEIEALSEVSSDVKKLPEVTFSDDDFQKPIYNVWSFAKKTNETSHFGNTEQRILDRLLYLFTEPFDIVVDPFGGGGSTLDACRKRMRRCWISDRAPKPGMEDKIRTLDVVQELPPLQKRWSEVRLTYLDPPYWKQAEGQYSDSPEDLANMPLEEFTKNMVDVVRGIAGKQSSGAISLIIQPTQWSADNREFTDHVFDICKGVEKSKNLRLWNRVQCPYSSEQCNPQMVQWAKNNKELLVLSRELIVWKVV